MRRSFQIPGFTFHLKGSNRMSQGSDSSDHDTKQNTADAGVPKPQEESSLIWTGCRYDRRAFRFQLILLAILTLAVMGAGLYWPGIHCHQSWKTLIWIIAGAVFAFVWIWQIVKILYVCLTVEYKLDSERLLVRRGLIRQTTDTVLIAQINDIKMTQTIWDRLINGGVGTLIVYSSDTTDPTFHLAGIDKPSAAFESIDRFRKDYVRRRGIKPFPNGVSGSDLGISETDC